VRRSVHHTSCEYDAVLDAERARHLPEPRFLFSAPHQAEARAGRLLDLADFIVLREF